MLPEGTAQRDVTVRDHRPYMGGFLKWGTPKTMGCNTQMVYDLGVPAHDLGNLHICKCSLEFRTQISGVTLW